MSGRALWSIQLSSTTSFAILREFPSPHDYLWCTGTLRSVVTLKVCGDYDCFHCDTICSHIPTSSLSLWSGAGGSHPQPQTFCLVCTRAARRDPPQSRLGLAIYNPYTPFLPLASPNGRHKLTSNTGLRHGSSPKIAALNRCHWTTQLMSDAPSL